MTGNSTIADVYPPIWRRQGLIPLDRGPPNLPPIDGPAVILAGSCADRTLEQLVAFEHHRPVIRIDPVEAAQRDLLPELFAQVQARLADGRGRNRQFSASGRRQKRSGQAGRCRSGRDD